MNHPTPKLMKFDESIADRSQVAGFTSIDFNVTKFDGDNITAPLFITHIRDAIDKIHAAKLFDPAFSLPNIDHLLRLQARDAKGLQRHLEDFEDSYERWEHRHTPIKEAWIARDAAARSLPEGNPSKAQRLRDLRDERRQIKEDFPEPKGSQIQQDHDFKR